MKEAFNMFKNDITQTYDHLDASAEILIMLMGAFLLGCLLCWLLRQSLIKKNTINIGDGYFDTSDTSLADSNRNSQVIAKKEGDRNSLPNKTESAATIKSKTIVSDFKIINGITPQIEELLRHNNINSFSALSNINHTTLNEIISSSAEKKPTKQIVKTWSHQAALAAKGDWRKLSEYQDFIEQALFSKEKKSDKKRKDNTKKTIKSKNKINPKTNNLQKIKGINPQIEQILNSKGIFTFEQLKKTDAETLRSHISSANSQFKNNQTATWSHQASMAEKEQWKELAIYQEFMDDIKIDSDNLAATIKKSKTTFAASTTFEKNIEQEKVSTSSYDFSQNEAPTLNPVDTNALNLSSTQKNPSPSSLYRLAVVKKTDKDTPDNLISKHDSSYDKSKALQQLKQDTQDHSDDDNPTPNPKQKDNLKLIEGIDPKIEEVLNNADILTFKDLKQSTIDTLKSILSDAGSKYRKYEAETWSIQAEMAHNKDWNELEEYQHFLRKP